METRRVVRVVEREWVVWLRLWRGSAFSYVFAPLLFLAAMGIGLGDLVNKHQGGVQGLDYLGIHHARAHGRERGDAGRRRVAVARDGRREVDGHVSRGGVDARRIGRGLPRGNSRGPAFVR